MFLVAVPTTSMKKRSRKDSRGDSRERSRDPSRHRHGRKRSRGDSRDGWREYGHPSQDVGILERIDNLEKGLAAILQAVTRPPVAESSSLLAAEESSATEVATQEEGASHREVIQHDNSAVEVEDIPLIAQNTGSVASTAPVTTEIAEASDGEQENLVPDFKMDLLGDNNTDTSIGSPVHNLIGEKWSSIFSNGLSKESKETLLKKYPVPQNVLMAKAPTLNTEIRHVIPASAVKRDDYQVATQRVVEALVAALANLVSELLKPEDQWDTKRIFELASDAGRIAAQTQHHISRSRRALIAPMLTFLAKNALDLSPIDKKLFGEQFLAKIKETSEADKLVKTLAKPASFASKPIQQKTKPQTNLPLGNRRGPAVKKTSNALRTTRAYQSTAKRRSRSRSRSSHHRR
ncbi:uncharacterized protein [Temnothorax longispinosus]|uniref:uncharacterized protein n=1 Tax=Temnothorax longispinosus TaxID=300112 RepID=UPI003A99F954